MISGPTAGEAARKDTARPISRVRSPEPDCQQFYDLVASEEHIQTIGNAPHCGHSPGVADFLKAAVVMRLPKMADRSRPDRVRNFFYLVQGVD